MHVLIRVVRCALYVGHIYASFARASRPIALPIALTTVETPWPRIKFYSESTNLVVIESMAECLPQPGPGMCQVKSVRDVCVPLTE